MWRSSRLTGLLTVGVAALFAVASAQASPPLQQRVLRASELPGFKLDGQIEIVRSAQAWYHAKISGRYKDAAALQARGFVAGALEHLYRLQAGAHAADAVSGVIQFKTARGAAAHLGQTIAELRTSSAGLKQFAVPGIPGAQAAATAAVDDNGFTIAFADGRFWYLVSVLYPPNAAHAPTRASVIGVARVLYRRVHRA
jgi:hypothetical protein